MYMCVSGELRGCKSGHNNTFSVLIKNLRFLFFSFSLVAGSNIGPVCLPNVGLNITDRQKGWITQFSRAGNGGETVMISCGF